MTSRDDLRSFLAIISLFLILGVDADSSIKIVNKCRQTIWPGLISGSSSPQLSTTGFHLRSGRSRTVTVPTGWSGRIWGRTFCSRNTSTGRFECASGDCGSGEVGCGGGGAKPPATLAELTVNGAGGLDFYDVSLVDGYNLPMLLFPKQMQIGRCAATGCLIDLNGACPKQLSFGGIACRSACETYGYPEFCCTGDFQTPDTCAPTPFSLFFKNACPRSYSYAYDDKSSTFTCASSIYIIVFCPSPYASQKLLGLRPDGALVPLLNTTTMYLPSRYHPRETYTGR